MQKITPNFWFDDQVEAAAQFYTSLFPDSRIGAVARYDKAGAEVSGKPEGSVVTIEFELDGQQFVGLNGGPLFKLNPSISFHCQCATEEEAEALWPQLSEGGDVLMPFGEYPFSKRFGWCNDRFGVSWQVILVEEPFQQKFVPALMFVGDVCGKAEEAVHFYTSLFAEAALTSLTHYGENEGPDAAESVQFAAFSLAGQAFSAMDSALAHNFSFNEALSFIVNCQEQKEVDYYWEKLTADGGEESMCGWLKDKYGVSWQIVPQQLMEMIGAEDKKKAGRAMAAMLKMKKLDIAVLQKAFDGN